MISWCEFSLVHFCNRIQLTPKVAARWLTIWKLGDGVGRRQQFKTREGFQIKMIAPPPNIKKCATCARSEELLVSRLHVPLLNAAFFISKPAFSCRKQHHPQGQFLSRKYAPHASGSSGSSAPDSVPSFFHKMLCWMFWFPLIPCVSTSQHGSQDLKQKLHHKGHLTMHWYTTLATLKVKTPPPTSRCRCRFFFKP